MTLTRKDYLLIVGIVLLLLVGVFLIEYYFSYTKNECMKDPFVFGAKQMEDTSTGYFSGIGYLKNNKAMFYILMFLILQSLNK